MPPQDPQPAQSPQNDPDFAGLSPGQQHAYLLDTDPDYKALSPAQQKAYLHDIAPTHGAGTPQEFAAEKTASGSIAPPLTSPWEATKYGMREFGGGMADIGRGIYNTFLKPPETTAEKFMPPGILQAKRMGQGLYDLGRQAMQVPGAIRDLYHSPDPLGSLALTAPRVGGQTAGTIIASDAPEAVETAANAPLGRTLRAGAAGTKEAMLASPLIGKPMRAFGRGFMRSWNAPAAEASQAGALARGVVSGAPSQALGRIPVMQDPYANIDAIRGKLTAVPAESRSLGEIPPTSLPQSEALGRLGTTAGEKAALRNFMTSNPSALGRIGPEPAPPGSPLPPGALVPKPPRVTFVPEPRTEFPGEQPNYMASVPRAKLGKMAVTRKPGAGTQLQQLGEPIIYIPNEADYPGPLLPKPRK